MEGGLTTVGSAPEQGPAQLLWMSRRVVAFDTLRRFGMPTLLLTCTPNGDSVSTDQQGFWFRTRHAMACDRMQTHRNQVLVQALPQTTDSVCSPATCTSVFFVQYAQDRHAFRVAGHRGRSPSEAHPRVLLHCSASPAVMTSCTCVLFITCVCYAALVHIHSQL